MKHTLEAFEGIDGNWYVRNCSGKEYNPWGPMEKDLAIQLAAAPDLLEAAKDVEFLLRKTVINWKEARFMVDSLARSANDLRAAIAKTERGDK